MLLPKALLDPQLKAEDGFVILMRDEKKIPEYGVTETASESKCYVAVSPGDKFTVIFNIPSGELEFVDLIVDGILRSTVVNHKHFKIHRGAFTQACHRRRQQVGGRIGKTQACQMMMENRTTAHDRQHYTSTAASNVGILEVRILRKIPPNSTFAQAVRTPGFDTHEHWWNLNNYVDTGPIPPTMEVTFTDDKDYNGGIRKHINQPLLGYYHWVSFKFVYRSASDLKALGFDSAELETSALRLLENKKNGVPSDSTVIAENAARNSSLPATAQHMAFAVSASGFKEEQDIDTDTKSSVGTTDDSGIIHGALQNNSKAEVKMSADDFVKVFDASTSAEKASGESNESSTHISGTRYMSEMPGSRPRITLDPYFDHRGLRSADERLRLPKFGRIERLPRHAYNNFESQHRQHSQKRLPNVPQMEHLPRTPAQTERFAQLDHTANTEESWGEIQRAGTSRLVRFSDMEDEELSQRTEPKRWNDLPGPSSGPPKRKFSNIARAASASPSATRNTSISSQTSYTTSIISQASRTSSEGKARRAELTQVKRQRLETLSSRRLQRKELEMQKYEVTAALKARNSEIEAGNARLEDEVRRQGIMGVHADDVQIADIEREIAQCAEEIEALKALLSEGLMELNE